MKLVHLPTPEEPDLVVIPTDESDLYLLSKIIKTGDHIGAKTTRKVAVTQTQNVRKSMYLNVCVQQLVYQQTDLEIIITGKVLVGSDDVAAGQMHTLHIGPMNKITITPKDPLLQTDKEQIIKHCD